MSNTQTRILSGIVMLFIVILAAIIGQNGMFFLIFLGGVLLVDELTSSMLKLERSHFSYVVSIASFVIGFIFFNFVDKYEHYVGLVSSAGVTLGIILMLYLFMEKMEAKYFIRILRRNAYLVGVFVLIPVLSLSFLVHQKSWMQYILLLLLLNSVVDVGAWFWGKNFGKKKLWPAISPNKTLFGLFGGVLSSVLLSLLFIYIVFEKVSVVLVLALIILGLLAQIGDLIESKMKRQLGVKDSSNLIPGHGGIYDRVDSLIFIAPFFSKMVSQLL